MSDDVELSDYEKSEILRHAKIAELKILVRKNRRSYRNALKDFHKRVLQCDDPNAPNKTGE